MSETAKIQLQKSAIMNVPINSYSNDFTFIVNGEEFPTTKIISDLISTKISQIHMLDPTFDTYVINTHNKGNFSLFLQLVNFSEEIIPNDDVLFFSEILNNLQNDHITLKLQPRKEKITIENVIQLIQDHEKNGHFYSEYLREEIEFICKHFYELQREQEKELKNIRIDTLESILSEKGLQLRDETQLLNILNELYQFDSKYSILYKYVYFTIVSEESICEFIKNFDIKDIDNEIWLQLSTRLKQKLEINDDILRRVDHQFNSQQPKLTWKEFVCNHDNKFDGIINSLKKESNNNIQSMIDITASSLYDNNQNYTPYNVCLFEDKDKNSILLTQDKPNSWICFDFKDRRIIPTNYVIKSTHYGPNNWNPNTWILECSNDGIDWKKVDEQINNLDLDAPYKIHTFDVKTDIKTPMKYIRIRQTGQNKHSWGKNILTLGSIEFYGKLFDVSNK